MFTIDRDSQAGRELDRAFHMYGMHKVSIAFKNVQVAPAQVQVSIKVNEGMWSAPLSVTSDALGEWEVPT
jgi:hypothetical protein